MGLPEAPERFGRLEGKPNLACGHGLGIIRKFWPAALAEGTSARTTSLEMGPIHWGCQGLIVRVALTVRFLDSAGLFRTCLSRAGILQSRRIALQHPDQVNENCPWFPE
jgi:hypothetical protein